MNKKWIVLPCLVLAVIAAGAMPWLRPSWLQPEVALDRAVRATTIDALVAELKDHYVFPDKANEIEAVLRRHQRAGRYDGITDAYQLAHRLTLDVRAVARDLHLRVAYHPKLVLPGDAAPAAQADWAANNFVTRLVMRHSATRGMVRVGRLGPDIGYLKIAGFPDAPLVADKFAAAMDELADTDGLILDLRRNGGGDPQSVILLASYFVDQRTRLNDIWDRDTGATTRHWTQDQLAGKRYGGTKPVMILVGPGTASAGEDFTYTLQALKRATVVGERTWGGAHPTSAYRIGGHFIAWIPNQRSISPITGSNWEGVGVIPDRVTEGDALAVARQLMQGRLHRSTAPGKRIANMP